MPDLNPGLLYQGVQESLDKYDQLFQNAKVADAMVKANPDLPQRMGFASPEQFKSLSAQDKIAATTGYIKAQGVQEFQAKMRSYEAQASQNEADVKASTDANTFLQRYGKLTANGADPKQAFYDTLGRMPDGFNAGRAMPRIMDSLQKWQSVTTDAGKEGFFKPEDLKSPLPVGYDRVVTGPNSSQVVAVPTAEGPMRATDGNYFFDGKKWMTAKGNEVAPAAVLTSLDRENASLRAQMIYMSTEEKAAANEKIQANEATIGSLRSGGRADSSAKPAATGIPRVGEVRKGYRYKGGNPADKNNWEAQ